MVKPARRRSFVAHGLVPLVLGPILTAVGVWAILPSDVFEAPAWTVVPAEPQPVRRTLADEVVASVRDITPEGVTTLPPTDRPLRRVIVETPAPAATASTVVELEPETVYNRITVLEAGSFRVVTGSQPAIVRIAGVAPTPFDATCTDAAGTVWKCGARARAEFARLIGGRSVSCRLIDETDPAAPVGDCRVGPRHLGRWLVENGWTDAAADGEPDFPDLAAAAAAAAKGRHQPAP